MREADLSLFEIAVNWLQQGSALAVATVIKTWGSSPCPAGSMLLVDSKGNFQGSVSGGCVESAVIATALDCIAENKTERLRFAVSNDRAWEVGLACGGEMDIWVEPVGAESVGLSPALLQQAAAACHAQQSRVLVRNLSTHTATLYQPDSLDAADADIQAAGAHSLATDNCQLLERQRQMVFIQPVNPALRMLIIGAVHIAQKLITIASTCGYHLVIIDPRQSFASEERFPDVLLHTDWPDKALETLKPDHRTAVITLTHDPKLDEPALAMALHSSAFYIGALGKPEDPCRQDTTPGRAGGK